MTRKNRMSWNIATSLLRSTPLEGCDDGSSPLSFSVGTGVRCFSALLPGKNISATASGMFYFSISSVGTSSAENKACGCILLAREFCGGTTDVSAILNVGALGGNLTLDITVGFIRPSSTILLASSGRNRLLLSRNLAETSGFLFSLRVAPLWNWLVFSFSSFSLPRCLPWKISSSNIIKFHFKTYLKRMCVLLPTLDNY